MADPINYTQSSGFSSAISCRAMDYNDNYEMSRKLIPPDQFCVERWVLLGDFELTEFGVRNRALWNHIRLVSNSEEAFY